MRANASRRVGDFAWGGTMESYVTAALAVIREFCNAVDGVAPRIDSPVIFAVFGDSMKASSVFCLEIQVLGHPCLTTDGGSPVHSSVTFVGYFAVRNIFVQE